MPSFESELEAVAADRLSGSRAIADKIVRLLLAAQWPSPIPVALFLERARAVRSALPTFALIHDLLHRTATDLFRAPEAAGADPVLLRTRVETWRTDWERAQDRITAWAIDLVRTKRTVLTLSNSAAVRMLLQALADREMRLRVLIGESLPGGEGRLMARALAGTPHDVVLLSDTELPRSLRADAAVVLGADAVFAGHVLNKVGSGALADAARAAGCPVWVLAETAKWCPDHWGVALQEHPATGALFEPVAGALIDRIVAEEGAWPFARVAAELDRKPVFSPLLTI